MNTDLFTLLAGSMAAGALMFVVVVVPLVLLPAKKKQWQAAEELKQITAATRAYIEDLDQERF
jgi:hypothetical protein